MKKKLQILSFFIAISFFSCDGSDKKSAPAILDMNTDFPISEKIEFKPFNKYDILEAGGCLIEDSILWYIMDDRNSVGNCYHLKTGEKISTITTIGKAAYEFTTFPDYFSFVGDSLQFYTAQKAIKTFSKKDIIENIPVGERNFSVTNTPDSISVGGLVKLPNGSVIATISSEMGKLIPRYNNEFNKNQVAIYNSNESKSYQVIDYNSFGVDQMDRSETPEGITVEEMIESAYSNGSIRTKGNDMAVFSVLDQFMLYTFDINSGKVGNEKRYTKMKTTKEGAITNDMNLSISRMESNDHYILCFVDGYFSKEDKEMRSRKLALFVFDWNLNPIKRFDLPVLKDEGASYYTVSIDCSSLYLCEYSEDGLALSKADLNLD